MKKLLVLICFLCMITASAEDVPVWGENSQGYWRWEHTVSANGKYVQMDVASISYHQFWYELNGVEVQRNNGQYCQKVEGTLSWRMNADTNYCVHLNVKVCPQTDYCQVQTCDLVGCHKTYCSVHEPHDCDSPCDPESCTEVYCPVHCIAYCPVHGSHNPGSKTCVMGVEHKNCFTTSSALTAWLASIEVKCTKRDHSYCSICDPNHDCSECDPDRCPSAYCAFHSAAYCPVHDKHIQGSKVCADGVEHKNCFTTDIALKTWQGGIDKFCEVGKHNYCSICHPKCDCQVSDECDDDCTMITCSACGATYCSNPKHATHITASLTCIAGKLHSKCVSTQEAATAFENSIRFYCDKCKRYACTFCGHLCSNKPPDNDQCGPNCSKILCSGCDQFICPFHPPDHKCPGKDNNQNCDSSCNRVRCENCKQVYCPTHQSPHTCPSGGGCNSNCPKTECSMCHQVYCTVHNVPHGCTPPNNYNCDENCNKIKCPTCGQVYCPTHSTHKCPPPDDCNDSCPRVTCSVCEQTYCTKHNVPHTCKPKDKEKVRCGYCGQYYFKGDYHQRRSFTCFRGATHSQCFTSQASGDAYVGSNVMRCTDTRCKEYYCKICGHNCPFGNTEGENPNVDPNDTKKQCPNGPYCSIATCPKAGCGQKYCSFHISHTHQDENDTDGSNQSVGGGDSCPNTPKCKLVTCSFSGCTHPSYCAYHETHTHKDGNKTPDVGSTGNDSAVNVTKPPGTGGSGGSGGSGEGEEPTTPEDVELGKYRLSAWEIIKRKLYPKGLSQGIGYTYSPEMNVMISDGLVPQWVTSLIGYNMYSVQAMSTTVTTLYTLQGFVRGLSKVLMSIVFIIACIHYVKKG